MVNDSDGAPELPVDTDLEGLRRTTLVAGIAGWVLGGLALLLAVAVAVTASGVISSTERMAW